MKNKKDQPRKLNDVFPKNWLDDDKEWENLSQKSKLQDELKLNKKAFDTGRDSADVNLNINISLPKINSTRLKFLKKFYSNFQSNQRVYAYSFASLALVLGIGFIVYQAVFKESASEVAGVSESAGRSPSDPLSEESPEFQILYPGQKSQETIGKVARISPDGSDPAYAYTDNINEVEIIVSQQKLPKAFEGNIVGELEKTAKDFQANEVFDIDTIRVYHGKSSSGVQSLLFVKGNLLIFIKSPNELSEETWAAYISALHD